MKQKFDKAIILNQFANGMTISKLTKMYHTSFYNIQSIVKEHYTPRQGVDCTKLYDYIYEDYCNGMVSYKMLSNKHNVSLQVVRKAMRLHGVWQRNSFEPDYERKQRMRVYLQKAYGRLILRHRRVFHDSW